MKLYSIDILTVSHIDIQTELGTILGEILTYIILCKSIGHAINQLFDSSGIIEYLV